MMHPSLKAGEVTQLTDGVRRIIAPNPGMMTGPGTNTYLIGDEDVSVVDPGPAIPVHVDRIVAAAGAPIRRIFVTHTHPDHSPAAALLAAATGAELIGMRAPQGPHQDSSFVPDHVPEDGARIGPAGNVLEVLHTPGHASNHVCYLLSDSGWLFTGDHIINGSTVVIDPPDGNMRAYLEALEKLKDYPLTVLAPGHGAPLLEPIEAIDALIQHRLGRERKVVAALERNPNLRSAALVPHAYREIDPALYPLAERSLLAHLLKLEQDGRAAQQDGEWRLIA